MVAILTAALMSLVQPQQEGPKYEAELLTVMGKGSLREAGRINALGDYCGLENAMRHFGVIKGIQYSLPGPLTHAWSSEAIYDIDDRGNLYGFYMQSTVPVGQGVYIAQKGTYKLVPLSSQLTIAHWGKYSGFVASDGRIVFHVRPRNLQGHSSNCNAVQLRGETLTYFQTATAGAQGSIVTCMTEKGEAGGILLFGTVSQAGNLQVTRQSPAVWTEDNDLIPLERKLDWKHSMVFAMVDKDLAFGEAQLANGQGVSVVWIKGQPSVTTGVYNKDLFVSHVAKGNPVGMVHDGRKRYAGMLMDGKVWPLSDFVVNLPKNTILEDTMDVASDGSILAAGKKDGNFATFRLKPAAK